MRRILAALAATVLSLFIAAAPAAASSETAAEADARAAAICNAAAVCMFQNYSYGGSVEYVFTRPAGECVNLQSMRNRMTSFWNNSGRLVSIYWNQNCGGGGIDKGTGKGVANMIISYPWGGNDDAESVMFR